MREIFGIKFFIDIFNYIKKITSQKMLFILLILTMIWFISAMCKVISYNSKINQINVINRMLKVTDGKKKYNKVREDCSLHHTILLSGYIQQMNKYQKINQSMCFEYDFVCKTIVNIFAPTESDSYGFSFMTMYGLNDSDRYNVTRTVILNNKSSNYFIKSLIDKLLQNNNKFIYFTREQVANECPEFEKAMFGFSATKDENQVSFLLYKAPLVGEADDSITSYIFVAFVNQNEVKNIKCKSGYYIQDLLDIVINNYYKNSFVK